MGGFVVSLRSRGLASFSKSRAFDVQYHVFNIAHEVLDIFLSVFLSFYHLSWSGWISFFILIIVITQDIELLPDFDTSQQMLEVYNGTSLQNGTANNVQHTRITVNNVNSAGAQTLFLPPAFLVILPLILLVFIVFKRREVAAEQLGRLKAESVSLCLSVADMNDTASMHAKAESVKREVFRLMDKLHMYLQHQRPYARHFYMPYLSDIGNGNKALYKISHDLGTLLRQVHRSVKSLHEAVNALQDTGIHESYRAVMVKKVTVIHEAIEELSYIKELRTPLVMRCALRWMTVVMIPITMGQYWNLANRGLHIHNFQVIFGLLLQVALMAMVDVLTSFEDPFNDSAMDTISLVEILDHISVMTSPDGGHSIEDGSSQDPSSSSPAISNSGKGADGKEYGSADDEVGSTAFVGLNPSSDAQAADTSSTIIGSTYKPEAVVTGAAAAGGVVPPPPPMPPMA